MEGVAITLDTDWAPDSAIDYTAEILKRSNVKATWFVTHESPAIERLRQCALFEIGIHPNFLAGSSHGATPEEVLAFCMKLVPNAVSMRTHALVQSTPLLDTVLRTTPIRCDVSILLPYAKRTDPVELQWGGKTMVRIPYHWEDDVEMLRDRPSWTLDTALAGEGLRVFDFHPIHVFLNSGDMKPYEALKAAVRPLGTATDDQVRPFVNQGSGSQTTFRALVDHLAASGGGLLMRDIYDAWRNSR